jgi:hypothetical protein
MSGNKMNDTAKGLTDSSKPEGTMAMATNGKGTTKNEPGLVGRGFHSVDDRGRTNWQGAVLADLGGGYFLVQLFEWFTGGSTTQHVIHIVEFAAKTPSGNPRFRFFDSLEMANEYMDAWGRVRDEQIDRDARDDPGPGP